MFINSFFWEHNKCKQVIDDKYVTKETQEMLIECKIQLRYIEHAQKNWHINVSCLAL